MNWLLPIARVVGAAFPFSAALVQAQAEATAYDVQRRLRKFEDPISALHPDVRELAQLLYKWLDEKGDSPVQLNDDEIARYSRALAVLERKGLISGSHAIGGRRFVSGMHLNDPIFVIYMATLYEDPDLIERFVALVDEAPKGTSLDGNHLAAEYALPIRVVRAVFQLYEKKGFGLLSKEVGATYYRALV